MYLSDAQHTMHNAQYCTHVNLPSLVITIFLEAISIVERGTYRICLNFVINSAVEVIVLLCVQ
jgi:hypothetical protein